MLSCTLLSFKMHLLCHRWRNQRVACVCRQLGLVRLQRWNSPKEKEAYCGRYLRHFNNSFMHVEVALFDWTHHRPDPQPAKHRPHCTATTPVSSSQRFALPPLLKSAASLIRSFCSVARWLCSSTHMIDGRPSQERLTCCVSYDTKLQVLHDPHLYQE